MLGNSRSAVVTFEETHVPFYIKAYGLFTHCRPYRQTVQCCSLCGELGHRQDVCPNPDKTMCAQCHPRDPTPDHNCTPKCQLCGLAHPTASKDCRKKLRPPPPPLRDRERSLTSQRWQQQPSSNSQPPEQRSFPPNQPNQQQWKHADVTLIPKPGKPLNPKNLRPISLTSCVGKLFEHMAHDRLSPHVEGKGYFPDTMYGFRPHLSTQDILLQLKEEVLDSLNNHSKRSILALDIKGAFDNISHQAILQGVASTNCGERTYKYFASFLTNRTATVGIGHLRSDTFATIPNVTPQGSVVSPLLFNIAMKDSPPLLQAIPNLHHAIYADDLTLWVPTRSPGDQQDALQAAIQEKDFPELFTAPDVDCPGRSMKTYMDPLLMLNKTANVYGKSDEDVTVFVTSVDLADNFDGTVYNRVMGQTRLGGLCKDGRRVAIVEDVPPTYSMIQIIAHELAHTLGAAHDGEKPLRSIADKLKSSCHYSSGHLMAPSTHGENNGHFSNCSIEQIEAFVGTLPQSCLDVKLETYHKVIASELPGMNLNRTYYCQKKHPNYPRIVPDNDGYFMPRCKVMCCADGIEPCFEELAVDGMFCQKNKVCFRHRCVDPPNLLATSP
ncbi:venom metalloproteinase antarease-like TtrivMP_A [Ixodes scapularis]